MKDAVNILTPFYREHKEDFIARYGGHFIVMPDEQTVVPFKTFPEAYWFGVHNYGLGCFVLIHCVQDGVAFCRSGVAQVKH